MKKYYYENILANQNYVAKPNSVWVADITSFELNENKKVYVFLCIDIFSNKILISIFKTGEARLFFKYSDKEKGAVEVIAESDKDNETRVINNLKKNYE